MRMIDMTTFRGRSRAPSIHVHSRAGDARVREGSLERPYARAVAAEWARIEERRARVAAGRRPGLHLCKNCESGLRSRYRSCEVCGTRSGEAP
jgi:hypothetical protein